MQLDMMLLAMDDLAMAGASASAQPDGISAYCLGPASNSRGRFLLGLGTQQHAHPVSKLSASVPIEPQDPEGHSCCPGGQHIAT